MQRNDLLDQFSRHARLPVRPVTLKPGQLFCAVGAKPADVIFPLDAVLSFGPRFKNLIAAAAGLIASNSAAGVVSAVLDEGAISETTVQIGGSALACKAEAFRATLLAKPEMLPIVAAAQQDQLMQAQQFAACHTAHALTARLATLLLYVCEISGTTTINLTQDALAEILGVRRTSVSLSAHALKANALVSYKRGHVKITDMPRLADAACECHLHLCRASYRRPFNGEKVIPALRHAIA